jgi:hypothetical protein
VNVVEMLLVGAAWELLQRKGFPYMGTRTIVAAWHVVDGLHEWKARYR